MESEGACGVSRAQCEGENEDLPKYGAGPEKSEAATFCLCSQGTRDDEAVERAGNF